jgi:predicted HAD superfamily phosphohydrolase
MRYILDISGYDLKLIRASIVNFQRSLELSDQAEFNILIDDLDECFFKLSRMKKEQLNNKIKRKWGGKK